VKGVGGGVKIITLPSEMEHLKLNCEGTRGVPLGVRTPAPSPPTKHQRVEKGQ